MIIIPLVVKVILKAQMKFQNSPQSLRQVQKQLKVLTRFKLQNKLHHKKLKNQANQVRIIYLIFKRITFSNNCFNKI